MTFWEFVDRRIPEPRQWLAVGMLGWSIWLMQSIIQQPALAQIEFFKLLAQAVIIQGFLTTVLAFFYTASKSSEKERENLGQALDVAGKSATAAAIATAAATGAPPPSGTATVSGTLDVTSRASGDDRGGQAEPLATS